MGAYMSLKMERKRMINGMALQGAIWFSRIVQVNSASGFLQSCHKNYLFKKRNDKILLEMVAEAIGLKTAQMK